MQSFAGTKLNGALGSPCLGHVADYLAKKYFESWTSQICRLLTYILRLLFFSSVFLSLTVISGANFELIKIRGTCSAR